jgi:thiamine-phosphate pyrophosphorylase
VTRAPLPARGLYAVTDSVPRPVQALAALAEEALLGGAVLLQYRDKSTDPERRRREAGALVEICRPRGVPLIVNDDIALALACGANGVHLGRDDTPLPRARASLGPEAIIGASCYADIERALRAQAEGADYVAFGRFFPSQTKPLASAAPVELLVHARPLLHVRVVAIGGITPENAPALLAAGADLLAVVGGVFGDPDPRKSAARYARLFRREPLERPAPP